MKKRHLGAAVILGLFILLAAVNAAFAYEKTLVLNREDLSVAGATDLELSFSIGGAKVNIVQSTNADIVVQAVVTYSDPQLEPGLQVNSSGTVYIANFYSGAMNNFPPGTVHEWEITVGTYDVDTNLVLNFGGARVNADFGGMPLTAFMANLGGDTVNMDFSTPTTRSAEHVMINAGGVALTMTNIGNMDMEDFYLYGGGAVGTLGFHGAYCDDTHSATMILAGSSFQVLVPENAGEHVTFLTTAARVSVTGDGWTTVSRRIYRKEYITDGYDTEPVKLDFRGTVTGSSLSFNRKG